MSSDFNNAHHIWLQNIFAQSGASHPTSTSPPKNLKKSFLGIDSIILELRIIRDDMLLLYCLFLELYCTFAITNFSYKPRKPFTNDQYILSVVFLLGIVSSCYLLFVSGFTGSRVELKGAFEKAEVLCQIHRSYGTSRNTTRGILYISGHNVNYRKRLVKRHPARTSKNLAYVGCFYPVLHPLYRKTPRIKISPPTTSYVPRR